MSSESWVGHTMREFDFSRPMSDVRKSRKSPYYREIQLVTDQRTIGFYCGSSSRDVLFCDRQGSAIDLRLERANEHLPNSRLSSIRSYYCDEDGCMSMEPIVARLPRARGFLAGWTMGSGMCASLDCTLWDDAEEAARYAHSLTESAAQREYEYRESEEAEEAEA